MVTSHNKFFFFARRHIVLSWQCLVLYEPLRRAWEFLICSVRRFRDIDGFEYVVLKIIIVKWWLHRIVKLYVFSKFGMTSFPNKASNDTFIMYIRFPKNGVCNVRIFEFIYFDLFVILVKVIKTQKKMRNNKFKMIMNRKNK